MHAAQGANNWLCFVDSDYLGCVTVHLLADEEHWRFQFGRTVVKS